MNSFYYQIGTKPGKVVRKDLASVKLDEVFGSQPSSSHVPLGMNAKGPAWRRIEKLDSLLIVGLRGSGITTLIHVSFKWCLQLYHAPSLIIINVILVRRLSGIKH